AERLRVSAVGGAEGVRVGDVGDIDRRGLERLLEDVHARERQRAERHAVVGDLARDRLAPLWLSDRDEMLAHDLPRGLDGLGATTGEERAVELAGHQLSEALGELDR